MIILALVLAAAVAIGAWVTLNRGLKAKSQAEKLMNSDRANSLDPAEHDPNLVVDLEKKPEIAVDQVPEAARPARARRPRARSKK